MTMDRAMDRAQKEAKDKAGLFRSDETDFGKGGREQWITNRAREIMGEQVAVDATSSSGIDWKQYAPGAEKPKDAGKPKGIIGSAMSGGTN